MQKNILFIAPTFFGYYQEITKELENQGYHVDYVSDIPNDSNFYKAVTRINRTLGRFSVNRYYKNIIKSLMDNKKYDFVFVIVGMTFSLFPDIIKKMRDSQKDACFIMYQWDGEKNIKFVKKIHKYFNKIFTFDRIDSQNNDIYNFLPLFYIDKYEKIPILDEYKYDVSYIGTAHPQKIKLITEMSEKLKNIYNKQFIYNYMPSKLKFYYHKCTSKEYKNIVLNDLKLEKIPFNKTMEIFENSMCILDAPQSGQIGLTIRTIECLGANRKLITSNEDIVNYDFYKPENIYVYTNEFDYNNVFFKSKYIQIDKIVYEKYSLKNWLITIFKD